MLPLICGHTTRSDRTIRTSVPISTEISSTNAFLFYVLVIVVLAFNITNKVSDEVSSDYYFSNAGLSQKDPYSWEVSMRSCTNNNVSFTSKTRFCPTWNCFESNMPGADELLRNQSLSTALLVTCGPKHHYLKHKCNYPFLSFLELSTQRSQIRNVSQMALIVPRSFIPLLMYILSQRALRG
jgi:hypothetical protein